MRWDYSTLSNLCVKIGSGATPKGGATVYVNQGVAFIRSQNVYNLSFDYEGLVYINSDAACKLEGVTLQSDDVLLNITGDSVARTCKVPSEILPARVNQHVAIIRADRSKLSPDYLVHYLASSYMQAYMLNLAVGKGASRNALTKGMIEEFPIPIPPMEVQRRIADILSAYDDLIENNQKQIKLLEEAAQRLYREWFVELRFLGHETTPVVDGVPEGWELRQLKDIVPILTGKKDANCGTDDGAYPFFTCAQEPIKAPEYSFDMDAVILAGNGDFNVKLYRGRFEAYQRTYVLSPYNREHLFILFFTVQKNMAVLVKGASGSTIKFLTKGMIEAIQMYVPTVDILLQYNAINEDIQRKMEVLRATISAAQEARDRLLPKLMSGEVEV